MGLRKRRRCVLRLSLLAVAACVSPSRSFVRRFAERFFPRGIFAPTAHNGRWSLQRTCDRKQMAGTFHIHVAVNGAPHCATSGARDHVRTIRSNLSEFHA